MDITELKEKHLQITWRELSETLGISERQIMRYRVGAAIPRSIKKLVKCLFKIELN